MGGLLVRSEQQLGLTRSRRGGAGVTSEASDRATPPVTYSDPNGRTVILSEATWAHITSGHPELVQMLDRLRAAVEHPSRTLPGRTAGENWLYLELKEAPAPWLKVVVRYGEQGEGRVVTAFLRRAMP